MSRCKAILITILSLYSSSSLMGMGSLFSWFKKTDQSYKGENVEAFILFHKSNITDKDDKSLPQEIKDIIKDNYILLLPKTLISPHILAILNDQDRIDQYKGAKITPNDFYITTMSDEGKKVFAHLMIAIPRKNRDGIFEHSYADNSVTDITSLEYYVQEPKKHLWRYLTGNKDTLLLPHEYDNILKLPLNLRRKIGNLTTVKVVGKEQVSFDAKCGYALIGGIIGGSVGISGGADYFDYSRGIEVSQIMTTRLASMKDYLSPFSIFILEIETRRKLDKLDPLKEIKTMGLSGCCGAALGAIAGVALARDHPHKRVYNIEEKPLITLKEQIAIKSSDEDKAYNNELKFLLQHHQAMDDDWTTQSEKEKELNCEIFNHNRKAIEEEIKLLKNHRMIFTRSHMKNSDFENVQMERNAANTKKIWNNLPLHKKIIYGACSSPINPDVETFNNLQNKYYTGLEKKKLAIRE